MSVGNINSNSASSYSDSSQKDNIVKIVLAGAGLAVTALSAYLLLRKGKTALPKVVGGSASLPSPPIAENLPLATVRVRQANQFFQTSWNKLKGFMGSTKDKVTQWSSNLGGQVQGPKPAGVTGRPAPSPGTGASAFLGELWGFSKDKLGNLVNKGKNLSSGAFTKAKGLAGGLLRKLQFWRRP